MFLQGQRCKQEFWVFLLINNSKPHKAFARHPRKEFAVRDVCVRVELILNPKPFNAVLGNLGYPRAPLGTMTPVESQEVNLGYWISKCWVYIEGVEGLGCIILLMDKILHYPL